MDKAAADIREFLLYVVEDTVHNVVADICPCRVGENGRISGVFDGLYHCLYGKIAEICRVSVLEDGDVDWLVALIVRNPCIGDIDCHALRCDGEPSSGLADAEHDIRLLGTYAVVDFLNGFVDDGGNLQFYDLGPGDLIRKQLDSLPGRIDGFAAERVEVRLFMSERQ